MPNGSVLTLIEQRLRGVWSGTVQPRNCFAFLLGLAVLVAQTGCLSEWVSGPKKELSEELVDDEDEDRFIKDYTRPVGIRPMKVDSVALVTRLKNTGSDPPPGQLRNTLVGEIQKNNVGKTNALLADPRTSLVLVRAYLPPGVRKGDPLDVEVYTPRGADTKSLRGGWLMETRLQEVMIVGQSIKNGSVAAIAQGPVLVESAFRSASDKIYETRGRVLGGGISRLDRKLGLGISSDHRSVQTSTVVGSHINARFHMLRRGTKQGVATPKRDNYIELEIQPRYRHNPSRFIRVIGEIAVSERPFERAQRMTMLERMIMQPTSAARAALQLEAIGKDGIGILDQALRSPHPEVQFYAAEALAYLDQPQAAQVLAQAAAREPAFRWHAVTALAAMDQMTAFDALAELLHHPSAETRYGAFHAMQIRNPHSPSVRGEKLGDFSLHTVPTHGSLMLHFSQMKRAELVVFGHPIEINIPVYLQVGENITISRVSPQLLKVSHFAPGEHDRTAECGNNVQELIRAIVQVGGGYLDVLTAMQNAKAKGAIAARVVVDARPRLGRAYDPDPSERSQFDVETPLPELFTARSGERPRRVAPAIDGYDDEEMDDEQQEKPFLGRMWNWFGGE